VPCRDVDHRHRARPSQPPAPAGGSALVAQPRR
jgi:hypothetical protein